MCIFCCCYPTEENYNDIVAHLTHSLKDAKPNKNDYSDEEKKKQMTLFERSWNEKSCKNP